MSNLFLDILTSSSILFVVSSGLLLIFGVMKIMNFAHAAFLTAGGYAALISTQLGLNPWLALPLAFVGGAVLGLIVERLIVRPLYARPLDAILATWGLGIIIAQLITFSFGREVQFVNAPLSGAVPVLGENYSQYRLFMILAALATAGGIALVLHRTRLGLEARAVIANESLARGLGINSGRVRAITFALGAGLAALAGALITPLSSVDPNMGVPWLVSAFMLCLVSGASLASLGAAALVLGGAQVMVSTYVSPVIGGLTIVLLAAIILRIRPEGFARD
ncbi:Uncharacterised protein [Starkeya nomas]|uniref:High-affinity branched-chain amino acid transport system permease protein LivH n=1 Tax=Starkeya nomas TaxID=2666134 RepID=A0A5S9R6F8_9HYPH|nr:branched-chain amino acid ABC transporter permease [Starkeya nomas]CAA0128675.1 Uncharacterised protein [Starkeya nomas]